MKMQLYIKGKLIVEQLFTKEAKMVAAKRLYDRYRHATLKHEWAVYEIKESKMNNPCFVIKEDEYTEQVKDYQLKTA
jgi:hypothetical protein